MNGKKLCLGLLLCAAFVLTAVCSACSGIKEVTASAMVPVPNLVGMTDREAVEQYGSYFRFIIVDTVESEEAPAGCIVGQSPAYGEFAERYSAIELTVCKAPSGKEMPFLKGVSLADATAVLNASGHTCLVEYGYFDEVASGCVAVTEPEYAAPLEDGEDVMLTVSLGGLLREVHIDMADPAEIPNDTATLIGFGFVPENVDPSKVSLQWSSSDPNAAVCSGGLLTPRGVGSTVIEVHAVMTNELTGESVFASDSVTVTVTEAAQQTLVPASETPAVTAAPAQTASPAPYSTPRPTAAPGATATPKPTSTPAATATATPKPTSTPAATATATPKPTATAPATEPPQPTPVPTATPAPTPTNAPGVAFADAIFEQEFRKYAVSKGWLEQETDEITQELIESVTTLELKSCGLTDISDAAMFHNLTKLNFQANSITDVSPLAGLSKLRSLNLCYNKIADISPLSGLTGLVTMYIHGNRISDATPLYGLYNLKTLYIYANNLTQEQIEALIAALPNCNVNA